jgi:hypothetical protein
MTIECVRDDHHQQVVLRLEGVVEAHHVASMIDSLMIDATWCYAWLVEIKNEPDTFNLAALTVFLTHVSDHISVDGQRRPVAVVAENSLVYHTTCAVAASVGGHAMVEVFQTTDEAKQWLAVAV